MKWNLQLKLLIVMIMLSLFSIVVTSFILHYRIQDHFRQYSIQNERTVGTQEGRLSSQRNLRMGWNRNQQVFLNEVSRSIYLGGLLTIILAFGLSWFLAKRMSLPMQRLIYASQQIAQGKFRFRLKESSDDEWKALENAFNHMAGELENNEQLRKELIANLSHELATPLTNLKGYLEAMQDGLITGTDNINNTNRLLQDETSRMKRMLDQLRDLSIVESKSFQLDYQKVSLNDLIQRIVTSMEITTKPKQLKFVMQADQTLNYLKADPMRLHQILLNVLQNAVQYSSEKATITITTKRLKEPFVCIGIQDEGQGIHEKDLPHIFERFYRAEQSRSRYSGGTGIGLAIVKKLVEAHRGSITAKSQVGKGTMIEILLPI